MTVLAAKTKRGRRRIIREHRQSLFERAFDQYLKAVETGRADPQYLSMRGKKLARIR